MKLRIMTTKSGKLVGNFWVTGDMILTHSDGRSRRLYRTVRLARPDTACSEVTRD